MTVLMISSVVGLQGEQGTLLIAQPPRLWFILVFDRNSLISETVSNYSLALRTLSSVCGPGHSACWTISTHTRLNFLAYFECISDCFLSNSGPKMCQLRFFSTQETGKRWKCNCKMVGGTKQKQLQESLSLIGSWWNIFCFSIHTQARQKCASRFA